MKKRLTLLSFAVLALTGCCNPIDRLRCLVEDSTDAIYNNVNAVDRSTEVVCENIQITRASTAAIIENHKQLDKAHE